MSTEANEEFVRRFYAEVFDPGNLDRVEEMIAPDFVNHAQPPESPHGPEGIKQVITMLRTAFPDQRTTIEDVIAKGDKVVIRATYSGTHQGPFMGIPPTGKSFKQSQIHIIRMEDGKAVEHWAVRDDLGMMQQLGVIPAPARATA